MIAVILNKARVITERQIILAKLGKGISRVTEHLYILQYGNLCNIIISVV